MSEIKLCACGCGNPAPIASRTSQRDGIVAGQPRRFMYGHSGGHARHGATVGGRQTPEYKAYADAKTRCTNRKDGKWPDYGGRGIEFRFTSFEEFFAELGPRPSPAHSLDRIENDSHYEIGNVRWATKSEQNFNRRPHKQRISDVEKITAPQTIAAQGSFYELQH